MRSLRRCARTLLAALLLVASLPTFAHPMPGTEIAIGIDGDGARFDIAVPVPELRLALPRQWPRDADLLAEPWRSEVLRYFDAHFGVRARDGSPQGHRIESLRRWRASDPDVGDYEELQLRIVVPAAAGFDAQAFDLHYDAIIHQVPNHFAVVTVARQFGSEEPDAAGNAEVGIIRYDFARDVVPPLAVSQAPGSPWRGLRGAIALGFLHVLRGLHHLLFLATLLIVAPLRPEGRGWSLFQGWPYTLRRFVGISLAFTVGHSVALLVGAWPLLPVPRDTVEVLVAGSILLTAAHGIRPLFAGREWMVAGSFGLAHGLAFSERLQDLVLAPWARAMTVLGFNIGVEGAQLVAMAAALPLLLASRWRSFNLLRVVGMLAVVALALLWIVQRLR